MSGRVAPGMGRPASVLLRPLLLASLLLALMAPASGEEGAAERSYAVDLPARPGAEQVIVLPRPLSFADASAMRLTWDRDLDAESADLWLELCAVTSDDRFFTTAGSLVVANDRRHDAVDVALDAASWAGRDGAFGPDATGSVREWRVRLHGAAGAASAMGAPGRLRGTLAARPGDADAPDPVVQLADPGLVPCGPWREWRVRLLPRRRGASALETGTLELIDATGAVRPLFHDQPVALVDGRRRPRGAARWTLRLRDGESPASPARLRWADGARTWTSADLTLPTQTAAAQALADPLGAPAPPWAGAWSGRPSLFGDGLFRREARVDLPACPAPTLVWLAASDGFRGPGCVGLGEAAACDRLAAAGIAEVDLLPQWLFDEQGPFRFGRAPWHRVNGGPWQDPQDALRFAEPWTDWRRQIHALVARMRAAPGLARWRLGLTQSANSADEARRLRDLLAGVVADLARIDGRPVLVLHPQAADYEKPESAASGSWFDGFERGPLGWTGGPFPLVGAVAVSDAFASEGRRSLRLALPAPVPLGKGMRATGAMVGVDASMFNLDRLEFDALLAVPVAATPASTGTTATIYAWVTDHGHRWYQQRIAVVAGNRRWNTVGVDFSDGGAWQPVNHDRRWSADARRRIRRFGVAVFVHGLPAGTTEPIALHLDRFRRFGWPHESSPDLAIVDATPAPEALTLHQPIAVDFQLSIPPVNPYDPDRADVVGEVEGPDGQRLSYPAFWSEPFRLDLVDGSERAVASGSGTWSWRFAPPTPGVWRWRLAARVLVRKDWKQAHGPWATTRVGPAAADALPVVRPSATDPMWWETDQGRWFYPLGVNLRSPGDDRQDGLMAEVDQRRPEGGMPRLRLSEDYQRLGTRAYERYFQRMGAHGCTWARVWMAPWWCGLEWNREWDEFGGLVWYNQTAAARLDRVLDLAAAQRIYVQIELQNHGMTAPEFRAQGTRGVDTQWVRKEGDPGSPYAVENGGPCAHPREFYQRDEVWAIHAKRLRYTVARWGWRSHLAAWVLTSEMEFTGAWDVEAVHDEYEGHSPSTERWVRRSLDWFAANDPQRRPVSVHFSHPHRAARLWRMPGLGFSNSNAYTGFQPGMGVLGGGQPDLPLALDWYLTRHFPPWELKRPTLIGEWGGHWSRNTVRNLGGEYHTGLWLQAVMPFGGNTGFWWWLWIDVDDRWDEYARIAAFTRGDDPRGRAMRFAKPEVAAPERVGIQGMAGDGAQRYYAWLIGLDQDPHLRSRQDQGMAVVAAPARSRWRVQRWNCQTGKEQSVKEIAADGDGRLRLPLGVLDPDAAFKLDQVK